MTNGAAVRLRRSRKRQLEDKATEQDGEGTGEQGGNRTGEQDGSSEVWAPSSSVALKALFSSKMCAAVWNLMDDCDEVYNYWEPAHFMIYGKGFQTWEYSPEFALRSWVFVALHAFPGLLYRALLPSTSPLAVFFFLRCFLGFMSSLADLCLYQGIRQVFGASVARLSLVFLIFSPGVFAASSAFLPSSFAMILLSFAYGSWFKGNLEPSIVSVAIATFVGWPFVAVLGLPIALDILFRRKELRLFLKASVIASICILFPMTQIDSFLYGRTVFAPWNIVKYNVFSKHGPNLYGVEPWTFYVKNLVLNFNLVFPVALMAAPLTFVVARRPSSKSLSPLLVLVGFYFWLAIFFFQPHKEERFMSPIYPLFCLAAAYTLDSLQTFIACKSQQAYFKAFLVGFLVIFVTISCSRIVGRYRNHHGALDVYLHLSALPVMEDTAMHAQTGKRKVRRICLGKEWHRFPSHFFLPSSQEWEVAFLESEFKGQLPKHFIPIDPEQRSAAEATSTVHTDFNDENRQERSRFVNISTCDFVVDSYFPKRQATELEPKYSEQTSQFKVVYRSPIMDSELTKNPFRSFYVPFLIVLVENFSPVKRIIKADGATAGGPHRLLHLGIAVEKDSHQ
ncbi:unnamed protein product [Cyprideis torosa]|uniref:Mannosyltransferase n=1 Tax=Cyprideis torosa TaxID=163714 RepID=A0A7R8WBA8_9CRUS|nr:unnamed protein product [Cyprideis torosa]CAG0890674.1 unnamed protein product [Cyprideis torosa]